MELVNEEDNTFSAKELVHSILYPTLKKMIPGRASRLASCFVGILATVHHV